MSNNIDFKLKNAVEVGGPTKVTLGTITSSDIDLATGNYFADTLAVNTTYTISNAGDVQSFQLEVTGGTAEVAQNFSTTLYTGTGAAQTITNGIDLANDGGLVWMKSRTGTDEHTVIDTEIGIGSYLITHATTGSLGSSNAYITEFNSDGFDIGVANQINRSGEDFVSWTFKKEPSFFDVVTYTGDGVAGRQVSHSLGEDIGMLIIKNLDDTQPWVVWHRSEPNDYLFLNTSDGAASSITSAYFGSGTPDMTSSYFTLGSATAVNVNGDNFVAYLFAHDDAADGLIQCGSYTGNGSTDGPEINLGWEPQWLLIKAATRPAGENWVIYDTQRGIVTGGGDPALFPNDAAAEDYGGSADDSVDLLPTGFKITSSSGRVNDSYEYIYIAIRAASDLDLTWPSSIEWAGGVAPSAPATGETDVFTFVTDDSGTSYVGLKTADALS